MVGMQLVRYRGEFHDPVLALHRGAMEGIATGMTQAEEEADLHDIKNQYLASGGEFLIGIVENEVVAIGGFRRVANDLAEIKRMRIRSDLQGQGLGTSLLTELERRAREQGIRKLSLETAITRVRTPDFYRKHGYRECGRSSYGTVETLQFEKELH
jgi:ribosomal protein S18 acetylase RimI-like enzyme